MILVLSWGFYCENDPLTLCVLPSTGYYVNYLDEDSGMIMEMAKSRDFSCKYKWWF